jgi:sigma-B regulation protein RsbU (phosphoserine phosphatase)
MSEETAPPASPSDSDSAAAAPPRKTWRLDQLMLLGNVALVVSVVALSGILQAVSIRKGFDGSVAVQRANLTEQAHSITTSTARLLSITSSNALRDNDFAFLANLVGPVVQNDPNILRVRIVDHDGRSLADTARALDPPAVLGDRQFKETSYDGHPVLEYSQPIAREGDTAAAGAVIVDYSLEPLHNELGRLEAAKKEAIRHITVRMVGLGIVLILAGILFGTWQSRRVTQPLAALTVEALRIAKGNLEARVDESRGAGQELLTLGIVFNYMADQIRLLLERARLSAELDHQMQIAKAVQESFLPSLAAVELQPVRFAGVVAPADKCGGDFWAYRQIDARRLAICLGDVTGHGLSTALVAAAACSSFFAGTDLAAVGQIDGPTLMSRLNRNLFHMSRGAQQMSCSVAMLDMVTGEMEITNGAHPFPFIFNRRTKRMLQVVCKGPRLGEEMNSSFSAVNVKLEPGDLVVFYSDGVNEAEDAEKVPYGTKRLRATLERNGHLPVEEVRDALIADVTRFSGGQRSDDMTLIVTEYRPQAADLRAA